MIQGSEEWLRARAGIVTASRFKDVLASGRGKSPSATRQSYLIQIVTERLTGEPTPSYTNQAMEWGTEQEPFARAEYEIRKGSVVNEVGLIKHPSLKGVGASPDGLIGADGGLEIKSPYNSAVHVKTLLEGMPPEHMAQVQGNIWVNDREWWDFVSYDPRMPEHLQMHIARVYRDEKFIRTLEDGVMAFLDDVEKYLSQLNSNLEAA